MTRANLSVCLSFIFSACRSNRLVRREVGDKVRGEGKKNVPTFGEGRDVWTTSVEIGYAS